MFGFNARLHPALLLALAGAGLGAHRPGVCFAEGEGGDEGGGGSGGDEGGTGGGGESADKATRTFTQDDLSRIVAREVRKTKEENAKLASKLAELEPLRTRLEELEADHATRGAKDETDKKRIQAEREHQRANAELAEVRKKLEEATGAKDTAESSLKDYVVRSTLQDALTRAEALPSGLAHASAIAAAEMQAKVEYDDRGVPTVVVHLDGIDYVGPDAVAKATAMWLKKNPHFARAASGGTGTRTGGGGGGNGQRFDVDSQTADQLIGAGLSGSSSRK